MPSKSQLAKVGFGMVKTLKEHLQNKWITDGVLIEFINDALKFTTEDEKIKTADLNNYFSRNPIYKQLIL